MFSEGYHTYYVYIITNKNKTVLYIGVTNNLPLRLIHHRDKLNKGFTSRYNVEFLLHFEKFTWIHDAIAREKEIKSWRRDKKMELIIKFNPELEFLNYLFQGEIPPASE